MRARLLRWFSRHGRDLFWREGPSAVALTPFQVLLTEFLLWKTSARAESVIRRIVLAHESPGSVLRRTRRSWETTLRPLGLHRRRARCLVALAQQLLERHDGVVPADPAMLVKLTGIGQYAARATACMLAGSRLMPVDANTARLFARLFGSAEPPLRVPGPAWDARLLVFVPRRAPRRFLWAVMDLCAAHCLAREPRCEGCPLLPDCRTGRKRSAAALRKRNTRHDED